MLLILDLQPQELYKSIHELIRMAFPEYEIKTAPAAPADLIITVQLEEQDEQVLFQASIQSADKVSADHQTYPIDRSVTGYPKQIDRWAKIFIYDLLCRHCGQNINPYGILSGVRPVKIVHRLMDLGMKEQAIINQLENDYRMASQKASLLTEVAANNHTYLPSRSESRRRISVYIGIPYCPSRCYYCSFPGAILRNYETEIKPYLMALQKEINVIGDCIQDLNLEVESIYIGGGTPTVLAENDMGELLALLHKKFITAATHEITVEAGRPDTLSPDVLRFLQRAGVSRVCINPQTMHDAGLQMIGRRHQVTDIVRAVDWVREAGIPNLNMDIIVGLPGEGLEENIITGERVLALQPDNITVHSLAVKKGSSLAEAEGKKAAGQQVQQVQAAMNDYYHRFSEQGYLPYYLYRQKYMKASVENTGYALPSHFCLYNIQVMEERQTIIGIGGGASSKFVHPADWSLTSLHNPKDPFSYQRNLDTLLARKVDKLWALN